MQQPRRPASTAARMAQNVAGLRLRMEMSGADGATNSGGVTVTVVAFVAVVVLVSDHDRVRWGDPDVDCEGVIDHHTHRAARRLHEGTAAHVPVALLWHGFVRFAVDWHG
jgi:NADPH-dependent curcumin reductase CurA